MSDQLHVLANLPQGKEPWWTRNRRLHGEEKTPASTGKWTPVVQSSDDNFNVPVYIR